MAETPFRPTIRTQSDLQQAWERLMGQWGFGGTSVWLMLVVDDVPLPHLTELTDSDEPLDEEMTVRFVELLQMLDHEVAPGACFAFLRSRPGDGMVTDVDRLWASSLYDAARRAGVPCEVVHLATKGSVRPVPPDDLHLRAV